MAKKINNIIKKGIGTKLKENMGLASTVIEEKTDIEKEYGKYLVKDISKEILFDRVKIYNHFIHYAKEVSNKPFIIDEENKDLILLLCMYFARDERFKSYQFSSSTVSVINELDLDKGIMLFGNYGFGKSLIMRIFKNISIPKNRFYYHEANDIVMQYSKDGYGGLEQFIQSDCYYDDIGTEEKASHFEKGKELFKTIIEVRYNQFLNKGSKTHISSNLNPEEISKRYGERIESRIYEMFNIIVVNGTDRRKI